METFLPGNGHNLSVACGAFFDDRVVPFSMIVDTTHPHGPFPSKARSKRDAFCIPWNIKHYTAVCPVSCSRNTPTAHIIRSERFKFAIDCHTKTASTTDFLALQIPRKFKPVPTKRICPDFLNKAICGPHNINCPYRYFHTCITVMRNINRSSE